MNESTAFHCLAREIPGAEGPLVTKDGRILFVAPSAGEIRELLENGTQKVLAHTGGVPAGLQLDRNGDILVADMRRGILRVTSDGRVHEEAVAFEGNPVRGCNDLAYDPAGNLYITAPAGSSRKPGGAIGEIYFLSHRGELKRLDHGFAFPNGIAVNRSGSLLIFAETFTHKLIAYDILAPGVLTNRRTWAVLPGFPEGAGGDGMDFDEHDRLVATNYTRGTLEVYAPGGVHLRSIELPFRKCSNVHFLNDGSGKLLITEHENNAIWLHAYGSDGQPHYGWGA